MSYIIGSFNIRDFNYSNKSSDNEKIKRDFHIIAEIIIKEHFDVIGIQEVNSESAIKHLTDILNQRKTCFREWDYDFSGKAATTINDPEGYGFIWNKKRLRLLEIEGKNNPQYYNFAGGKGILRPPYYARFTARGMLGGANFELRLVNVHIRDAESEKDRIKEFDVLVRQVLPRICDHQKLPAGGEMMPAYTFLMGDYNLRLDKGERAEIRINRITPTNYTGKNRYYRTVQEEKTSLKQAKDQISISECYANNYDHFTYEHDLINKKKMKIREERIDALTKYFFEKENEAADILKAYRLKVSDHVPIKMTVDLK